MVNKWTSTLRRVFLFPQRNVPDVFKNPSPSPTNSSKHHAVLTSTGRWTPRRTIVVLLAHHNEDSPGHNHNHTKHTTHRDDHQMQPHEIWQHPPQTPTKIPPPPSPTKARPQTKHHNPRNIRLRPNTNHNTLPNRPPNSPAKVPLPQAHGSRQPPSPPDHVPRPAGVRDAAHHRCPG